jgi:cathepsin K
VFLLAVCTASCDENKTTGNAQKGNTPEYSEKSGTDAASNASERSIDNTIDKLEGIINEQHLNYAVGVTSVSGKPIEQITGEQELTKVENDSVQRVLKQKRDNKERAEGPAKYIKMKGIELSPSMPRLDLRDYGLATSVKDQNPAGSCWAFGAVGTFESNYKATKALDIDASEQYVINCSGAGTSNGGLAFEVFSWMVSNKKNIDNEKETPYKGEDGECSLTPPKTNYYAIEWEFVDPNQDPSAIPAVQQIKEAMCKYGAISASVYVTENFQYYKYDPDQPNKSYVFKEDQTFPGTNHAIVLIGWDDSKHSWLLKNSWGPNWGITCSSNGEASGYSKEKSGYMWIDYNTNNVGRRAAWIKVKR